MAIEIERKFLVTGDAWRQGSATRYTQGYLSRAKERTVRIRIAGNNAFITIKGPTQRASRLEFEYPIPLNDAQQLLNLCDGPLIDKTRYTITYENNTWEVDEFHGDNAGLVLAEIELQNEQQEFALPSWIGLEVTQDKRYFNSNLAVEPYCNWR